MDKLQFTNLKSSAIYGYFEIVTLILASTNHIFEVHTCIFGIPTTRYCAMPAVSAVSATSAVPVVDSTDSAAFRFLAMAKTSGN